MQLIDWVITIDMLVGDDGDFIITEELRDGRYGGMLRFSTSHGPGVCNGTNPEELKGRAEAIAAIKLADAGAAPTSTTPAPTLGRKYSNQTQIGRLYGVTPIVIGRILLDAGLKTKDGVSQKASTNGLARQALSAGGFEYWVWEEVTTCKIIEHVLLDSPGPRIADLASALRCFMDEAARLRAGGDDFFSAMIEDHAFAGLPPGLANVVRATLR